MKIGIIGILNNPSTSLFSHSAGMNHIVKDLFSANILTEKDNWSSYDKLIIYHGPNFKPGSFNIIGGINEGVILRSKMLSEYKGDVVSLDGFQLNEFSIKRKLNLYDNCLKYQEIELPKKSKIVIGDSHSLSVHPNREYEISRNDGKTLFGFLKENRDLSEYSEVILYFGNIDVRFHLCRQSDPLSATKELFSRYLEYALKCKNPTVTMLLPIENESRVLPKSGMLNGKNFYGSWSERNDIKNLANELIKTSGIKYNEWPDWFMNNKGELKFDIMEPKQSVHIKPVNYLKNHVLSNNINEQKSLFDEF